VRTGDYKCFSGEDTIRMKNTPHQNNQRDLDEKTRFNSRDQPGIHAACCKYGVARSGGQSGDYWKYGTGNAPEIAAGLCGIIAP